MPSGESEMLTKCAPPPSGREPLERPPPDVVEGLQDSQCFWIATLVILCNVVAIAIAFIVLRHNYVRFGVPHSHRRAARARI